LGFIAHLGKEYKTDSNHERVHTPRPPEPW
jgi:hypothetical protein